MRVRRVRVVTWRVARSDYTPLGGLTRQEKARARRALFFVDSDYFALRRLAAPPAGVSRAARREALPQNVAAYAHNGD